MNTATSSGITVKLFVGILLNSEVKMHLNYSDLWKQEQVIRNADGQKLERMRFQEKEYVGSAIDSEFVPLDQLNALESSVRQSLSVYCPELKVENLKVLVFPQLFVC